MIRFCSEIKKRLSILNNYLYPLKKLLEDHYISEICSQLNIEKKTVEYINSNEIYVNSTKLETLLPQGVSKKKIFSAAEERLSLFLNSFNCSKNKDVADFLKDKSQSLSFQKRGTARTYLIISEESKIIGYFAIAMKTLFIKEQISSQKRKFSNARKIKAKDLEVVNTFLIGQIGRDDQFTNSDFDLRNFLEYISGILDDAKALVGGSTILIEVDIDNQKLIDLYESYGFEYLQSDTSSLSQLWKISLEY